MTVDIEQECLACKILALDIKHEQLDVKFTYLIFCHIWPGIACERMIFVDYIMNALEHCKVRLPFFYTPCIIVLFMFVLTAKVNKYINITK